MSTQCQQCGRQIPLSEGPHYTPQGLACLACFRAMLRAVYVARATRGRGGR